MAEIIGLRTINSKTFDLGNGQRRLSTSIGVIHYKDNLGDWQDCDDAYSEVDGLAGFSAKFTKCLHHVRIKEDGARRIYPDRNDLSYWIQLEKPVGITMGSPVKSGNTWTWDFLHAQIKVQMQSARVKFNFILKDTLAPTSITIPFSVQGITRTGSILYHNSVPVAELAKPIAYDANMVSREATATFGVGQVTISLGTTGLTFPINIDPTVNLQVGASTDDCRKYYVDSWAWQPTGIHISAGGGFSGITMIGGGMRFLNVTIPQAATITAANISLNAAGRDGTTVRTKIRGENADNTNTFSTIENFDARPRTAAEVLWDSIPAWTSNTWYSSPEIKTVIQAVINRAGWASGNALVIFWDDFDNRSTLDTGAESQRVGYTYDQDPTVAPKLDITYSTSTNWTKSLADTMTLNDSTAKKPVKKPTDTLTLADAFARQVTYSRTPTDTLTLTDVFSRHVDYLRTLSDAITLLDAATLFATVSHLSSFRYNGRLTGLEKIRLAHGRRVKGYFYEHRVFDHTIKGGD